MACGCKGTCVSCLGSYRPAPPLAWAGWRLRVPGNPPGGQYHGYLGNNPSPFSVANPGQTDARGIFRSPGEVPPKANNNGNTNTFVERHSRRQAGYAVSPGAYRSLGAVAPVSNIIVAGRYNWRPYLPAGGSGGATSVAPQPPPNYWNSPTPSVPEPARACPRGQYQDAAGNCSPWSESGGGVQCLPGQVLDASGNCTSDERNPYVLYLPQNQQPAPVTPAQTSLTPTAGQATCQSGQYDTYGNCIANVASTVAAPSWFTDPTQELISGFPNWGLLAAAAAALMLLTRRK